ncbi:MAG: hypothetical protein E7163_03675 [Firmicutes bacterium]|nr:hypothetical protein [Bacillota bacterium]
MKFERIKSNKKLLIHIIIFLILGITIALAISFAAYKKTTTINISEGTVNYIIPDMKIMALKQFNSDANKYEDINAMPNGNDYAISSDSYCEVLGEKDENVKLYTNSNGEHVISNIQKNSRCYFYFVPTAKSLILANSTMGSGTPNFDNTSCTNGTNKDHNGNVTNCEEQTVGLYCWDVNTNTACTDTSVNKTYFYRGNVTDNYVEFLGFYWRIIRINENGSIRMIYSGDKFNVDTAGKETVLANGYNDSNTRLTYAAVDSTFHGTCDSQECMNFENTVTLNDHLYDWYDNYIGMPGFDDYLDKESGFCSDRSGYVYADGSDGYYIYNYGAYDRLLYTTNPTPKFSCLNSYLYTVSGSGIGNGLLFAPIGLITADEASFAGSAGSNTGNRSFYLYSGLETGTMSPCQYDDNDDGMAFCYLLEYGELADYSPGMNMSIRPVINLKGNIPLTGLGTIQEPYKVILE